MNQARAVLWAQWRTLRNYYPRWGAAWTVIIAVIWYGAWAAAATVIGVTMADADIDDIVEAFPGVLLLMFLYWQVIPLMMAASGSSLDLRRLMAYPIPVGQLFTIEVMLRITAGLEMLLILTGASIGVLFSPVLPAAGALAAIPFIGFNLLLALGVRDIVTRLMARRRIREVLAILFVMLATLPQVLMSRSEEKGPGWVGRVFSGDAWEGFPWTATAYLLQGRDVLRSAAVMAVWCAAAGVFALWQFRRTLTFDSQAVGARGAKPGERAGAFDGLFRLPSTVLRDPLAVMVEKEIRYLARSPRFRLVFLMGCTFGLFITRAMMRGDLSSYAPGYLAIAGLYSLLLLGEVCFWNSFGFDRSAVQNYFLAPVPFSQALVAKNISAAMFIALEVSVITLVCALLRLPMDAFRLAEAYAVPAVITTFLLAVGNLVSVQNARATNPQASLRTSAAGRVQGLLFLIYPAAFAPAGLAYLAGWALKSRLAFFGVLGIMAVIGGVVYKVALDSAAQRALNRREAIVTALSQGEGPIAS
jgi:ABC-2 type transport system permease protein